jgi:hypothetical protein
MVYLQVRRGEKSIFICELLQNIVFMARPAKLEHGAFIIKSGLYQ